MCTAEAAPGRDDSVCTGSEFRMRVASSRSSWSVERQGTASQNGAGEAQSEWILQGLKLHIEDSSLFPVINEKSFIGGF